MNRSGLGRLDIVSFEDVTNGGLRSLEAQLTKLTLDLAIAPTGISPWLDGVSSLRVPHWYEVCHLCSGEQSFTCAEPKRDASQAQFRV